jgi:hypothetical protein
MIGMLLETTVEYRIARTCHIRKYDSCIACVALYDGSSALVYTLLVRILHAWSMLHVDTWS